MSIQESDIKKLWGRAAGRCSHPDCNIDCVPFLDSSGPTVVGEMAHIIARSIKGPRGLNKPGNDTYANLILLCPTHHTIIDHAPSKRFPATLLMQWKAEHEANIEAKLKSPIFHSREALDNFIEKRLIENRACWRTYGPSSTAALNNPVSNVGFLWPYRKLSLLVPNNRQVISAIQNNYHLFNKEEYKSACDFVEHAEGFERNCTVPTEDVPRFPANFGAMYSEH